MTSRIHAALAAVYFVLGSVCAYAQAILNTRDYDNFLEAVVLQARNTSKEEWLVFHDPVVNFIARVRQDVERLPDARKQAFAKVVHNIGYWKGQEARALDAGVAGG